MRIEDINPVAPVSQSQVRYEHAPAAPPSPIPANGAPAQPEMDITTISGQLSLNGVTAYFQVQDGIKVVYSLVENSTGRIIRQVSPEEMVRLSGAIDEMLQHGRESSTEKGQ